MSRPTVPVSSVALIGPGDIPKHEEVDFQLKYTAPRSGSSFTAGNVIEFHLQSADSNLIPRNCYLQMTSTLTKASGTPQWDGEISSAIRGIRISSGGVEIENLNEFGTLAHLLGMGSYGQDYASTTGSLSGTKQERALALALHGARDYILPLNESGVFSLSSLPLFLMPGGLDIQITLVDTNEEVLIGATPVFTFTNVRLVCEYVRQAPEVRSAMIHKMTAGGGVSMLMDTWLGTSRTLAAATDELHLFGGVRNAQSVFVCMRDTDWKTASYPYFTLLGNHTLSSSQFQYGTDLVPDYPLTRTASTYDMSPFAAQFVRAMGRLGDVSRGCLVCDPRSYHYESASFPTTIPSGIPLIIHASHSLIVPNDIAGRYRAGDWVTGAAWDGNHAPINGIPFRIRDVVPVATTDTSYVYITAATTADVGGNTVGTISHMSSTFVVGQNLDPADSAPETALTIQSSAPRDLIWKYTVDTLGTTKAYAHVLVKKLITLRDGQLMVE